MTLRNLLCCLTAYFILSSCSLFRGSPLSVGQFVQLTSCPISLALAKKNLLYRGYVIVFADKDSFSTAFKRSDFEDAKALITREVLTEYHRRFSVFHVESNRIYFRYDYRLIRTEDGVVTYKNPSYFENNYESLLRIRSEVCGIKTHS